MSVAPQALAEHLDDGWGDDSVSNSNDEPATAVQFAAGRDIVNEDDDWDLPSADALAKASVPPISSRPPPDCERDRRPPTTNAASSELSHECPDAHAIGIAQRQSRPAAGFPPPRAAAQADNVPLSEPSSGAGLQNTPTIEPTEVVLSGQARGALATNFPPDSAEEVLGVAAAPIDITIEPSFPQVVDPDNPILPPPPPTSKVDSVRPPAASSGLSSLDAGSSMSPVTTATMRTGKSKVWLIGAAAVVCVGAAWGIVGSHQSKVSARRGLSDSSLLVVAAQPAHLAAAGEPSAIGESPSAEPAGEPIATQLAAQPPQTGTIGSAETAPTAPATAPPATAKAIIAVTDGAANKKGAKAFAQEPPSASTSTGQSSRALNAPIVPAGLVDPRAFPANSPATVASKVRVEVDPPDSKIAVRGRSATAPYVFDVPKGERVVLEVARAGYITRRIVLDGSREFVRIGMIPEPKRKEPAEPEPVQAPSSPDEPKP